MLFVFVLLWNMLSKYDKMGEDSFCNHTGLDQRDSE